MGIFKEFQTFAVKGNAMDMAVGIIIGGAFGKIVSSLVNDVIMPPVGKLMGGVNFSQLFISLGHERFESLSAAQEAGAATLNYGNFIQTGINFLIVSFSVFVLVKAINSLKRKEEKKEEAKAVAEPNEEIVLLREIAESLRK